jgi:DNA mismatch endonuclease (patch repair protein)
MGIPYPIPASATVSLLMKRNKRRDTLPEIRLRSALHGSGLRFRVDMPIRVDGRLIRPDVVFPRAKTVVFLDGCFWHQCPSHGHYPLSNTVYWRAKLDRNSSRDRHNDEALAAAGWDVIRVWEHEEAVAAAELVGRSVRRARTK